MLGRESRSARVYSEPLGEVNGSTTKLGASYFNRSNLSLSSVLLFGFKIQFRKNHLQEVFSIAEESLINLERQRVFVLDLLNSSTVERKDLGSRKSQNDWRMRSNYDLNVIVVRKQVVEKY